MTRYIAFLAVILILMPVFATSVRADAGGQVTENCKYVVEDYMVSKICTRVATPTLPAGLLANPNWPRTNLSVNAKVLIGQSLRMNGMNGNGILIGSMTSTIPMAFIAYNDTVLNIRLAYNETDTIQIESSASPTAVYADARLLSKCTLPTGQACPNDTWSFNDNRITVTADPLSFTFDFGQPATGGYNITAATAVIGLFVLFMIAAFLYVIFSRRH